ncbi:MAG: hypothetical protein KDA92_06735, partial [Planctomycetales bacterium]|nr:hypothetical protein [Planctomycetales bacterium]
MSLRISLAAVFAVVMGTTSANAAEVMPMIGGAQVGMMGAPMKHLDISFDGAALHVHVDDAVAIPVLRPLIEPDTFSATEPWAVLQDKAYNFQYGWNAGGFITLPEGANIWVENLETSPGLEVYSRPPSVPSWTPIFGTSESSPRWSWSGTMTHNAYAVLDPFESEYTAQYRVYLGDAAGNPLEQYSSDTVTLAFAANPILLGDFNRDGELTTTDIDMLSHVLVMSTGGNQYDVNRDGIVDLDDHAHWVHELKHTWLGDANLDGEFNTADFVSAFSLGGYEQDTYAGWADGDWNGDERFGTSDLIAAFQDGGYENG